MLRRKLLLNLGPVVGMLVVVGIVAIVLLQGVLNDLDHVDKESWVAGVDVAELNIQMNTIEATLHEVTVGPERHLDALIDAEEKAEGLILHIGTFPLAKLPSVAPHYQDLVRGMPDFRHEISALATTQDVRLALQHQEAALVKAVELRQAALPLSRAIHEHARREQEAVANWFRWLVLALALIFLVVINVSVVILLHMGGTILRPIDKLVAATKELARENFHFRVQVDQHDEFDQLAQAYNSLAEQLQVNEQRRIETLRQVALAMNHELNNALSIINLQLQLLNRQAQGNPGPEKCLRQISASLERVTRAVESLRNARRIVLTDYIAGTKMLDLEKSAEEEDMPVLAGKGQ